MDRKTRMHTHRTFGRTTSRLDAATLAKLAARLEVYAFAVSDLGKFDTVELEVGMGNGLALFERAKAAPATLFVGSEVYQNGLRSLVNALEQYEGATGEKLANVRITGEDARKFMAALPNNCIDRVCLLYPDPWPKARHKVRRMFTPEFVAECDRLLKNITAAELFVATDIPDYILQVFGVVQQTGVFVPTAIRPTDWATAPAWWQPTKYEAKAAREGRFPFYVPLKRVGDAVRVNHNLKTKA